jgi:ATP-dependent Clp protease ATP-binding subunit ClpA
MGPLDLTAKPCPHCGTVVLPGLSPDPIRLQCGHCGFRFLNVPPEKLQLGTSVLLDKQQQGPWYTPQQQQQQQQQQQWTAGGDRLGSTHHSSSLSQTPADVAAAAAVGGSTVTSHAAPPHRRTAVAVQEPQTEQQQELEQLQSDRWEQQQQWYKQQQQQQQQQGRSESSSRSGIGSAVSELAASLAPSAWTRSHGSHDGSHGLRDGSHGSRGAAADRPSVSPQDILQVVAEATGIPQHLLSGFPAAAAAAAEGGPDGRQQQLPGSSATAAALQELSAVQSALLTAVQGQAAAVAAVIGALRLTRMGLAPHHSSSQGFGSSSSSLQNPTGSARPALSLLMQGPSGVGKTTMAKTLAEALLPGEPQGIVVFSCGELSERHSISRLVGAPPGYVGYGKGGLLTEALRRRPYSVVVFDDVERAHPDVVGLLLQVCGRGGQKKGGGSGRGGEGGCECCLMMWRGLTLMSWACCCRCVGHRERGGGGGGGRGCMSVVCVHVERAHPDVMGLLLQVRPSMCAGGGGGACLGLQIDMLCCVTLGLAARADVCCAA